MNLAVTLLFLLNLAVIGLLPRIFFRKGGRLNLMWWLTAAPFILCSGALLAASVGMLLPFGGERLTRIGALAALPFSASSFLLVGLTLGTHRIPIALWHQENDAPRHVTTYGAYRRIRHPFYASFLLTLFGAVLACPHALTLVALVYGYFILNFTAAREERYLQASAFGAEYAEYMKRTGRFWPSWR